MREISRHYLLEYLQDEFRLYPQVRIRIPRILREENDGILVKSETREYFFPTIWVEHQQMNRVEAEVRRIKEYLDR